MKKIILIFSIFLLGCSVRIKEFSETKLLMGTTVEIKVLSYDETIAKKSISDAFGEIARVEDIFSVYKPASEISQLNKNGSAIVSDEVIQLIKKSNYFSEISAGAFDITVLPIIELWKNSRKKGKRPSPSEIESAKKLVGWRNILINEKNKKITFAKKGMKIDFGGIAKGYAVERAVEVLKKNGVKTGLVNAGGNIGCFGEKVFKVALQNPRDKNSFITVLKIKNKSVATSGDYERYFFLDKTKISHIINPLSGYSADKSISSTIIADSATDSDALSTAAFVMGPKKGIELIRKYKNSECLIIDKEKNIYKTTGFASYE
ncbi:MAG: FAD:protein FMN transferase [Elusimicrobiota bacterium]|nr:FAD:protein FMN transferase [Elusimicrobiota bacterium]